MAMPEPRLAIKGNTPIPPSPGIVAATRLGFNAEQAISILVAKCSVANEWGEAAMWQNVCHIIRQKKNDRRWTKDELNRMMTEAEDE